MGLNDIYKLVKSYSNEGDIILDNCKGSGTTDIACVTLNRSFIGIELNKDYFENATDRIEEAKVKCQK